MYNILVHEMAAYSHVPGRNPLILNTWLREPTTHDVANLFDESGCGSRIELWPNGVRGEAAIELNQ